ncbi:hypothetical protein J2X46_003234 [Nocardioides sp. BE266]|uniref:hypothetical protein n=1 Tax=Nocardioides sp. BE266 TaxID=2817725 RepID=UPI002856B9CE|nr:hypothetical protein [Nocardioides sp. BE266]MDR7254241.1 hypothetical protein [Nocardioides sp. BE266]
MVEVVVDPEPDGVQIVQRMAHRCHSRPAHGDVRSTEALPHQASQDRELPVERAKVRGRQVDKTLEILRIRDLIEEVDSGPERRRALRDQLSTSPRGDG